MRQQEKTLQYYNDNASTFIAGTLNADMSDARNRFLKYVSQNGLVLDWGCGSGRDSLAFRDAGYQVEATDASEELCKLASEKLGAEVRCERFDELKGTCIYDGIWACASLLHIERNGLPETMRLASTALKSGGVMYVSFKYGDFEGERNGRYFTDMTESSFAEIWQEMDCMELLEQWISDDVRTEKNEKWLNAILRKDC